VFGGDWCGIRVGVHDKAVCPVCTESTIARPFWY